MKPLLYLVHRIPFPPNKGDKIRSFNWLKGLSKSRDIYLGAFVDDENDWQYVEQLNEYCVEVHVEKMNPKKAKVRSLKGLLTGDPLTLPYYASQPMQQWVSQTITEKQISDVLVFSSSMAQFVDDDIFASLHRIADFVDMDSDKWMQYAENKQWPTSWVYQRESKKLLEYEKKIARSFDKSIFVSNKEAELFSKKLADSEICVDYVNNGVDTNYFNDSEGLQNPYETGDKIIVFTGAMDYWANVDAAKWFAEDIFPKLREQFSGLQFFIVGSKPTQDVLNLQTIDGINVTGFVEDVRPYILFADVSVAPMRIARGIQNKVLEAMSLAKTVIVSPQGFEGIDAQPGKELLIANSAQEWIALILSAISKSDITIGQNARNCVIDHYSWQSNIVKLSACFDEKNND